MKLIVCKIYNWRKNFRAYKTKVNYERAIAIFLVFAYHKHLFKDQTYFKKVFI
jgi:hypothetical protein